jgi:hypothetical protein
MEITCTHGVAIFREFRVEACECRFAQGRQAAPTARSMSIDCSVGSLLGGRCRGAVVGRLSGVGMVGYARVAQETTSRVHDRVDLREESNAKVTKNA